MSKNNSGQSGEPSAPIIFRYYGLGFNSSLGKQKLSNRRKRQEIFRVLSKAFDAFEKMTGIKFPKKGLDSLVRRLSEKQNPQKKQDEEKPKK